MATSTKFDVSSTSPDRPFYTGQRGSHIAASLDRSGSFRESMENPILSSLPNMSRSSSSATQGDVLNFFNCVRFVPKLVAPDHKYNRQMDYKRHISAALGISPHESPSNSSKVKQFGPPVPEDIKRLRDGLHVNSRRARERAKMFSEALSRFNKDFQSITSKKRSRAESYSNDRTSFMLSDRSGMGPSIGKIGVQGHLVTGSFDHEQQKLEERTKPGVPNKRTRTSLVDVKMDVRTNSLVRSSGTVDREKEMPRIANNGAVQGEDRALPIGGDGWEKSKMKKKRSGIKPDGSPSTTLTKPINIFHETKQGMPHRQATDARSKLSNNSHSFRPGVSNGTVGPGKSDGISQQSGMGIRISAPRNEPDNNSAVSDRQDGPVNSDKERVTLKAVNKATVRDEFNSGSPNSSAKMNTSIRAPRSGSGVAPKLSPVVSRSAVPNDWEPSNCTSKPPAGVGTNNRKRQASTRSSSPPVVHWQRPQKSSRTARRTNLVPVVSSNDDSPALDSVSDVTGSDLGSGFARRLSGGSPQQIKLKGDSLSSAALSESEESGVAEVKPKDKGRKPNEIDQRPGQHVQKVFNLVPPARKNKLGSGDEQGDGVRRQGRTGRNTRSLMPRTSEKLGNIGTVKQLRSSRQGFEKSESKAGRPPTRKLSDRKAYARQKHTAVSASADFHVGSEDGHEELLAAAKGVISSARAFSTQFWRQMEPFFGSLTEEDIAYWKQKINIESSEFIPTPVSSNIDDCEAVVNGSGLMGGGRDIGPGSHRGAAVVSEQLRLPEEDYNAIPLCQRLMSALISEECGREGEDVKDDAYDTEFEIDGGLELSSLDHHSQANYHYTGQSAYNGYSHRITRKPEHDDTDSDAVYIPSIGVNSSHNMSISTCSESEYNAMDINGKILLELQSIGIATKSGPEILQTDDGGVFEDIAMLEEHYQRQISKRNGLLEGVLKSASVTKEVQEKVFEERSLDKIIVMAYEKYMACWGRSSGGKNTSTKMANKQAALGFVKRTLERCHQFEDTGKSCFNEPLFKDMFRAASSQLSIVRLVDGMEAESAKLHSSSVSVDARIGSVGSQKSRSQFSQNMNNHDHKFSDILPAINNSSEQTSGKEDLWPNRVKKRELSLDDVRGTLVASGAPSGIGGSLSSSAKGKRSERDRDGKGQNREAQSRNGTTKVGRPTLSGTKGERKPKTKPKQKAGQHSVSVNGLLGKLSDQSKPALPSVSKSNEMSTNVDAKGKNEVGMGELDEHEPIDLSNLQLPGMDVLGVPDDHGPDDLGSWLNIDDDGLQDQEFMGLEIPMDDLSDLNMIV